MKKKLAVCALAAAALVLFSACTVKTETTFSPNWQKNSVSVFDGNYKEELTYALSFENEHDEDEMGMRVELDGENSSYTTTLEAVGTQTINGVTYQSVYRLRSRLTIAARFVYTDEDGQQHELAAFGGEHGDADVIETEVWFHSLDPAYDMQNLEPILSTRTVNTHTPVSLGSKVNWYNYSVSTAYDTTCDSAVITVSDGWGDLSDEERNVSEDMYKPSYSTTLTMEKLQKKYSAFDNAQLYFLGRGLTFTTETVKTVNVVSEAGASAVSISCAALEARNAAFYLDDMAVNQSVDTAKVTFSLSGTYRGTSQTVYYAQKTEGSSNTFYNLPLRIEEPFEYGIGTMVYSLASAYHG